MNVSAHALFAGIARAGFFLLLLSLIILDVYKHLDGRAGHIFACHPELIPAQRQDAQKIGVCFVRVSIVVQAEGKRRFAVVARCSIDCSIYHDFHPQQKAGGFFTACLPLFYHSSSVMSSLQAPQMR